MHAFINTLRSTSLANVLDIVTEQNDDLSLVMLARAGLSKHSELTYFNLARVRASGQPLIAVLIL